MTYYKMPRNRLPRVMKYYSPTGRRNHGRPLKRLWIRETGTGQQVAQLHEIYDDDDLRCVASSALTCDLMMAQNRDRNMSTS